MPGTSTKPKIKPRKRYEWKLKADKVFAQYVRQTREYCELGNSSCGTQTLQTSHNYSKASSGDTCRWDDRNVMLLCDKHHRLWESMPKAHKDTLLRKRLGPNGFKELRDLRNETRGYTIPEIKKVIDEYKSRIS